MAGSGAGRLEIIARLGFPDQEVLGEQIASSLRDLGIAEGDALILHSALSSLGYVVGGADAVIDAVLDVVGSEGTVMVPCLTDTTQPFDHHSSPSVVGRVTEVFRLRKQAVRSRSPVVSVAAIGPMAEALTEGHDRCSPCGEGSPYEKLCRLDGWVLLIGIDQNRNTMLHTAETLAGVAYLQAIDVPVLDEHGRSQLVSVEKCPMGHREFIGVDRRLREAGIVRTGQVGNATLRLMPANELVDFGMKLLEDDPLAFLCRRACCVSCRWAEARIKERLHGELDRTDWDRESSGRGCDDVNCEVCYVSVEKPLRTF